MPAANSTQLLYIVTLSDVTVKNVDFAKAWCALWSMALTVSAV